MLLGGLGLDLEAATPAGADAPVFSPVVGALIAGELGGAVAPGSACTQARSVLLAQYGSEDEEEGDGVEQVRAAHGGGGGAGSVRVGRGPVLYAALRCSPA